MYHSNECRTQLAYQANNQRTPPTLCIRVCQHAFIPTELSRMGKTGSAGHASGTGVVTLGETPVSMQKRLLQAIIKPAGAIPEALFFSTNVTLGHWPCLSSPNFNSLCAMDADVVFAVPDLLGGFFLMSLFALL